MTVPLVHDLFAVDLADLRARFETRGVRTESHRAAHVDHGLLLVHEVDHRVRRLRVELGRVRTDETADIPRERDDRALQPEAQPEVRDVVLARERGGGDLAFDAAHAEAAGHDDAVEAGERALREEALGVVGRDPLDHDLGARRVATVLQRFDDREVRVGQVDVLAHQADVHFLVRGPHALDERTPFREIRLVLVEVQHPAEVGVEAFVVQHERDLVEDLRVDRGDDALGGDVAELRDLLLEPGRDRPVTAAHDRVGLDAPAAQLGDGVLGRLGLLLARRTDVRHERDVHVEDVLPPDLVAELPDRFQERQDLDVADRAADLGDHDVDVVGGERVDARLDLVGDVRDDLHRLTQVLAAAFLREHRLVDRTRGRVRLARERDVDEALVVAEVQVGLALVVGDEHFPVLERVHGAGVDVDVRVELLHRDPQPATLEQSPERRGREALPQTGRNTTGHEDVLGHLADLQT